MEEESADPSLRGRVFRKLEMNFKNSEDNSFKMDDFDETKPKLIKNKKNKKLKKFDENESVDKEESQLTNSQKENPVLKKAKSLRKSTRKPLKVLFSETDIQKKDETKDLAENISEQANPSTEQKEEKGNETLARVTVYEDVPELSTTRTEAESSQPCGSLDSAKAPNIWDRPGFVVRSRRLSLKPVAPLRLRSTRRSLNDLSMSRMKMTESLSPFKAAEKKSTAKLSPRELEEITGELEVMFPDVDPDYLRSQCVKFKGSLSDAADVILIKKKKGELPTRADYEKRQETERLQTKYKENFSVENFLRIIPDPWEYFLNVEKSTSVRYADHSLHYLKSNFKKHFTQTIQDVLARNEYSLYLSYNELQKKNRTLKMRATNRSRLECDAGKPLTFDVQFMHEVAFIENENKIKSHLKKSEGAKVKRFEQAEKAGALLDCQSCCDYNFLPEDVINCSADHVFCKDCVVRYADVEMENKNFCFKCLAKCEEKFSMELLQAILGPAVIASVIRRHRYEELKPEGIKNLVSCPFCYHIVWMPSELTVLRCSNPSCTMESCRYCNQVSHATQKCSELENLELINKKLEDTSTDSLQTCSRCKKELVRGKSQKTRICSACRGSQSRGSLNLEADHVEAGDNISENAGPIAEEENPGDVVLAGEDSDPTGTLPTFFLSTDSISF